MEGHIDPARVPAYGCDLYLLKHWDEGSSLLPDEQMVQLFAQFVALPIVQRRVFIRRAKRLRVASSHPPADQALLACVRPPAERLKCSHSRQLWLRTYYRRGSDEALAAVLADLDAYGQFHILTTDAGAAAAVLDSSKNYDVVVFSDTARYGNLGGGSDGDKDDDDSDDDSDDTWQRIFHRMPQQLDVSSTYEARLAFRSTTHTSNQQAANFPMVADGNYDALPAWLKGDYDEDSLPDPDFEGNPVTEADLEDISFSAPKDYAINNAEDSLPWTDKDEAVGRT